MPRVKQETRKCSAAGCENKHLARGLCRTHYQRARDNYEIEINRPEKINGGECLVGGCGLIAITRGFCSKHYAKFQRYGDPLGFQGWTDKVIAHEDYRKCSVDGCDGLGRTKGLCPAHYQRFLKHGDPTMGGPMKLRTRNKPVECSVDGCVDGVVSKGFCSKHYAKFLKYGDPLFESDWYKKRGEKIINDHGYVEVYVGADHPMARDSRVGEHRLVMSEHLGRPLFENENVHHKNGDKTDNSIENLELWVVVQPAGQRPPDLLKYAREIIERYEPEEHKYNGMYRDMEFIKPKLTIVK